MKNKSLKYALIFARIMQFGYFFLSLLFIYFVFMKIYNLELPKFLNPKDDIFFFIEFYKAEQIFSNLFNTVFFSLRALLIVTSLIIALELFIKIIKSIKSLKTFSENTSKYFKKIAVILFLCFILSLIDVVKTETGFTIRYAFEFYYIMLGFFCIVLSEVFKEGNKLWEENQLTF